MVQTRKGNLRLTEFQRKQERILTDRAKHSSEFTQTEMDQLQRLKMNDLKKRIVILRNALTRKLVPEKKQEHVRILIQLLEHRYGVLNSLDITAPQKTRAQRLLSSELEGVKQLKAYAKINRMRPKIDEVKRDLKPKTIANLPNDTFKRSIEAVGFTAKTGISNLDRESQLIGKTRESRELDLSNLNSAFGYSFNALGTLYEWAKEYKNDDPAHALLCLRELHDALLINPLFAGNKKFQASWLKKIFALSEEISEDIGFVE